MVLEWKNCAEEWNNKMKVNYLLCTGCGACENICPSGAIEMQQDKAGFLYPYIEKKKCIHCRKCVEVCQNYALAQKKEIRNCYAAWASDEIRRTSSSGGIFTVLADYVLAKDGYVCGAAYVENTMVKHVIIKSKQELEKLRTSKYVQSSIGLIYKEIKKILYDTGKTVLFTGTPCQVAGLYLFLGDNPENLYTIDILCHGVPSQSLFDRYLIEKYHDQVIRNINFRDKSSGWTYKLKLKIETDNAQYISDIDEDAYYKAFNSRLSLRESCGICNFASLGRMGDISLGDFWEIWVYEKTLDDRKGTSLVLLNSTKGIFLFDKIIPSLQKVVEVPLKHAMQGNVVLCHPISLHENRTNFFDDLQNYSLKEAVERNIEKKDDSHE